MLYLTSALDRRPQTEASEQTSVPVIFYHFATKNYFVFFYSFSLRLLLPPSSLVTVSFPGLHVSPEGL